MMSFVVYYVKCWEEYNDMRCSVAVLQWNFCQKEPIKPFIFIYINIKSIFEYFIGRFFTATLQRCNALSQSDLCSQHGFILIVGLESTTC